MALKIFTEPNTRTYLYLFCTVYIDSCYTDALDTVILSLSSNTAYFAISLIFSYIKQCQEEQ